MDQISIPNHSGVDASTGSGDGFSMYATSGVLDAVSKAVITRSHGQLLAALRESAQESALGALLAMDSIPCVDDVKLSIEAQAIDLSFVAFDRSDCGTCRFNSSNHPSLYGASIRPGLCVNSECAKSKWDQMISAQERELAPQFRVIRIAPSPNTPPCPIKDEDVGAHQASQCRMDCKDFGAMLAGNHATALQRHLNVCTNSVCHAEKQEAHRAAQVLEIRNKLWRGALSMHVSKLSLRENRACLLTMLSMGWQGSDLIAGFADMSMPDIGDRLKHLVQIDEDALAGHMNALAGQLCNKAPIHQVQGMLRALDVKLQTYSRMGKPFLLKMGIKELDGFASDMGVEISPQLRKARGDGRLAFANALMAVVTEEQLVGYVPAVFRP